MIHKEDNDPWWWLSPDFPFLKALCTKKCYRPVILKQRRLSQEDGKFETSLGCIVSSRLA